MSPTVAMLRRANCSARTSPTPFRNRIGVANPSLNFDSTMVPTYMAEMSFKEKLKPGRSAQPTPRENETDCPRIRTAGSEAGCSYTIL